MAFSGRHTSKHLDHPSSSPTLQELGLAHQGMTLQAPANHGTLPCIIGCASDFADALETLSHGALEAFAIGAFEIALAYCLAHRDTAKVAVLRYFLIIVLGR